MSGMRPPLVSGMHPPIAGAINNANKVIRNLPNLKTVIIRLIRSPIQIRITDRDSKLEPERIFNIPNIIPHAQWNSLQLIKLRCST